MHFKTDLSAPTHTHIWPHINTLSPPCNIATKKCVNQSKKKKKHTHTIKHTHTHTHTQPHGPVHREIIESWDYRKRITLNRWDCQVECGIMSALHISVQFLIFLHAKDNRTLASSECYLGTATTHTHTHTHTNTQITHTSVKACWVACAMKYSSRCILPDNKRNNLTLKN